MGNTMVCPTCRGAGFYKVPGRKRVVKPGASFEEYEKQESSIKACKRCNGQGFIHLTH